MRLCLKTLFGLLVGLCDRFFVGFAHRTAVMRLGSTTSIRALSSAQPIWSRFQTGPHAVPHRSQQDHETRVLESLSGHCFHRPLFDKVRSAHRASREASSRR